MPDRASLKIKRTHNLKIHLKMAKSVYLKILRIFDFCKDTSVRVPEVPFRVFDRLKKEIQNPVLRFCFYFKKKDEIQIINYHFHV